HAGRPARGARPARRRPRRGRGPRHRRAAARAVRGGPRPVPAPGGAEGRVHTVTAAMRAAMFHAPRDVRIECVRVPEPGPGEVLVRIDAALTDGTDAKCYLRGHPVLLGATPSPFGHEYAGTVAAVGDGTRFRPGDRVAGANSAPCDACEPCLAD